MIDARRRGFLRGAIGPQQAPTPAPRPPWAIKPETAFTERCTRCGDCLRACPRGVLKAGDGGYPVIDFAQQGCSLCGDCSRACPRGVLKVGDGGYPVIDFAHQGCSLCGDCSRACPTGAIGPVTGTAFVWRVQIAGSCLAQHGVECRLCGDACDASALRFVPARGGIAQLSIAVELCTGCGDCVAPCPVGAISLT